VKKSQSRRKKKKSAKKGGKEPGDGVAENSLKEGETLGSLKSDMLVSDIGRIFFFKALSIKRLSRAMRNLTTGRGRLFWKHVRNKGVCPARSDQLRLVDLSIFD